MRAATTGSRASPRPGLLLDGAQARVQGGPALRQRVARGLHLLELVPERQCAAKLVLLGAEHRGEQAGRVPGRLGQGGDAERVLLAVERGDELAHEDEAVGETSRGGFDRRSAVCQRGEILLDRLSTELEALEVGRQRLGAGRSGRLGDVGGRRQQLRREFAHRRRGALRVERGLAPVEDRLRLLEQRGPAVAAARQLHARGVEHARQARPGLGERVERRGRPANRGAGLQRDVLRKRGERGLVAAKLRLLARGLPGQQQHRRRDHGRDERDHDQRGLQPGGIESVGHGSYPIRLRRPRPPGIRRLPPAGRRDSRAGSAR